MKRLLTTACLLVTVVVCALAQSGAVRGKIVDAQSKDALDKPANPGCGTGLES